MRIPRILAAVVAAVLGAGLAAQPVAAHTSSTYFPGPKFGVNSTINYGLATGFPTGAYRDVIYFNARPEWNNAGSGNEPNLYWGLADDVSYGPYNSPCSIPGTNNIAFHFADLDAYGTGVIGQTFHCASGPTLFTSSVVLDSDRTWYAGTGDAPGSSQDWWSAITHEIIHAHGWIGHLSESDSACPDDSTRATMCPTIYIGTERQRTTELHDEHTIDGGF